MKIELREEEYQGQWRVTASAKKGDQLIECSHILGPDLFAHPNEKMSTYFKNYTRNVVTREVIEAYYSEE
ncbi:hypothetical protein [Bacteriophage Titan-X]|uniref:Uncharacterized protein n=1 Tax=Bacteriophage Titan-X TaxID=2662140 RepID=A0A5Q2U9D8_9CAUD|nr:hypothetical protein [Bacteriophage Titan-X]